MGSLQELCANWLLRPAPDRIASEAREHITRESPDNGLRHILLGPWGTRGILMYKVFPRNLYATECHTNIVLHFTQFDIFLFIMYQVYSNIIIFSTLIISHWLQQMWMLDWSGTNLLCWWTIRASSFLKIK